MGLRGSISHRLRVSLATTFCGTISVTCRTVGLIRVTGLKGLETFTGLGVCSRFRQSWVAEGG